jgi:hypothetical protein
VEEGRLAYRVRTAEASDAAALRDGIGTTLAHPDHQGRRESYSGAASRGDILILERYDRAVQHWQVAGFVECHMRVDDNLSIRDIGTTGDEPPTGVVRYLLDQAFNSFRPVESQVKIRRDATVWLDIFRNIPGFYLEGEEYRRPHYWTIWRWDRQRARDDERPAQPAAGQSGQRPRPPRAPTQWAGGGTAAGAAPAPRPGPPPDTGSAPPRGPGFPARGAGPPPRDGGPPTRGPRPGGPSGPGRPTGQGGPGRPSGPNGPARPPGPRANRPPGRPSRPAKPR